MAKLWEEQDQQMQMLHLLMTKLKQTETIVDQDNIAKRVHKEVARVYFNIAKVDQGDGNKLWLALIKSIEEKDKVKLSAKALDYIQKKFIPVKHMTESLQLLLTHAFKNLNPKKTPAQFKEKIAGDSIFRDRLMHMGFRAVNKYTIADPDRPNTEPGHSQRSVKWWRDVNLKGACVAKPRTKGSSLFKYVDFPSQAPKREGLQIGKEIDEKEDKWVDEEEDKWVDKEEDKWVDEDKDKWVDEDEDRQEEEQVGGIGNEGKALSQPDLHPEDVEAWAPQPPPKTSSLNLNGVWRTGPGSYDVVAKLAKSTPSRSVEEDLEASEDPELESSLCSQLAMAASLEETLLRKRKHDSPKGTQRKLLAVAGRDDKRPWPCTSSTLEERQPDSGRVGDATTQCQPPTREATLKDDTSLKLGKARSTRCLSTQPAVVDDDKPTQADIDLVCKITPTQNRKSD